MAQTVKIMKGPAGFESLLMLHMRVAFKGVEGVEQCVMVWCLMQVYKNKKRYKVGVSKKWGYVIYEQPLNGPHIAANTCDDSCTVKIRILSRPMMLQNKSRHPTGKRGKRPNQNKWTRRRNTY